MFTEDDIRSYQIARDKGSLIQIMYLMMNGFLNSDGTKLTELGEQLKQEVNKQEQL